MKVAIPDASSLPQSYASRAAAADFEARFAPPANAIVYFAAAEPPKAASHAHMQKAAYWKQAYSLVDRLRSDRYVAQAEPLFRQSSRMLIRVTLLGDRSSAETHSWLRHWEHEGLSASDTAFLLGGEAKYEQEVLDEISSRYLYVLLFIVTANYMVLFAAFRSILIPLKAIAMNLLSLGAAFGILTWLFEGGHLGIEPYSIAVMIPVFIFGLVFGISMDYGVFLLSRIAEIYERTGDNDASVREGVASTGRMITCAAAILIAVTLPFAFGDVVGVRQLGAGIAAAIFIDATIVRMVLVPALMKLLGRWNWWTPV
jgi:RND superfamily putative drug exporter